MRRLFDEPLNWRLVSLAVIPTAAIAYGASRLARTIFTRATRALLGESIVASNPLIRTPRRLIATSIFVVVFVALIFPAFEIVGLHPRLGVHLRTLSTW